MSSEVHLTRAQKWDLARLAVAAVASSVFFSLPIVLAGPQTAAAGTSAPPPSVRVSEEIAIAGISEPVAAATPAQADTDTAKHADAVAVVTSTKVVRITRPSLSPLPASEEKTAARPIQVRARVNPSSSTPTQPATLSRRLGRFLTGDGKYDPKPFPTVSTSGM
jgi:hypothetical protein